MVPALQRINGRVSYYRLIIQQAAIMKRQGVDIPLLENLGFKNNKSKAKGETKG